MESSKTVKLKKFDPAFDAETARRLYREGMRNAVFGRMAEEAKAGRAFAMVDGSFMSQELLDELVRLGYSVTKRQYEGDPVRIAWGEDFHPRAGEDGVVTCVEARPFNDATGKGGGFCSDY